MSAQAASAVLAVPASEEELADRMQIPGAQRPVAQARLLWVLLEQLNGTLVGPAPSLASLAAATGVSKASAQRTLATLKRRGLVRLELTEEREMILRRQVKLEVNLARLRRAALEHMP
jgi:hypothetical protein